MRVACLLMQHTLMCNIGDIDNLPMNNLLYCHKKTGDIECVYIYYQCLIITEVLYKGSGTDGGISVQAGNT